MREGNIITDEQVETIRKTAWSQGRRAAIIKGLGLGLGAIAVFRILGPNLPEVKGVSNSTSNLDFTDQGSDPVPPLSGKTRVYTKNGLLYEETPTGAVSGLLQAPSYVILNVGSTIYANPAAGSGLTAYSGTDAATVINKAIAALTSGGKIFIKAGTYTISGQNISAGGGVYASIGTYGYVGRGVSNIELCGEGPGTILKTATNLNGCVIGIYYVNNWYVHDLVIDGNQANQSAGGISPQLNGLDSYNLTNSVFERVTVQNCKTFGIQMVGSDSAVLDCYCLNNNANGMVIGGPNTGQGRVVVRGNRISGASDVGISVQNINDVLVEGNTVYNISLNLSPWGLNTHEGIITEGTTANRVIIKGNAISLCSGSGTYPGMGVYLGTSSLSSDVTIEGNQIYNCAFAMYLGNVANLLISSNTLDTFTATTGVGAVYLDSSVSGCTIQGNTITNASNYLNIECHASRTIIANNVIPSNYGIKLVSASNCQVIANQLIGKPNLDANNIEVNASPNAIVADNEIEVGNLNWGIALKGASTNCLISRNVITSTVNGGGRAIDINSSTVTDCRIINNVIIGTYSYNSSSLVLRDLGVRTFIVNNSGLNPFGSMSNPFNNTNTSVGTNGAAAGPAASTDYAAQGSSLIVNSSGGTGVSITIKDPNGNTVQSGLATLSGQRLPFGYKINFGALTGTPPTVTVFGE